MRVAYCGGPPLASRLPLTRSRKLDAAARLLARGASLEQAELSAGYPAERSLWIEITGARSDAAVERTVGQRFCGQLADPRLRQIGTWRPEAGALWIVVAQPFLTPRRGNAAAISRVALALTNRARAQARNCGSRRFPPAPPLGLSAALTRAALAHSEDMAAHSFFSHAGSDGSSPGERATRAGYRWSRVGENIASGAATARRAVADWLASPDHCANIMTAGFRQMGIAFAVNRSNPELIDWTEDFGRPLIRRRQRGRAAARAR